VALLQKNLFLNLLALLFFIGMVVISYKMWFSGLLVCFLILLMYLTQEKNRFVSFLFLMFLVSLSLYQFMNILLDTFDISRDIRIILNRSLLTIMVAGLYIAHLINKKEFSFYNHKPQWKSMIILPFHSIKLSHFMIQGMVISAVIFIPFIIGQEFNNIKLLLVFCILFSVVNACLEELIWRGILFSSLIKEVSVPYALVITSLGFGLLHLTIGFPFIVCLLFSLGGLFYGMVVLKTNSIYPGILFHLVINIGMVFGGIIL
jgi:uncharacterized protein